MADSNTTITDLLLMEDGSHDNDWGQQLNAVLTAVENMTKATRTTNTTGGTTTLTKTTAREYIQRVTGILSSNCIIEVPNVQSQWCFINETTGNYTVTVKVSGQTGVTIPKGSSRVLRGNGTDVTSVQVATPRGLDQKATTVGGTVDALTLNFTPPLLALTPGAKIRWTSSGANTVTNPTLNPDTLGAATIKKGSGSALAVGDTGDSGYPCDGEIASNGDIILLNPATGVSGAATAAEYLTGTSTTKVNTPAAASAGWKKGSDIAGGSTITFGDGRLFNITGTGWTVTSFAFTVATLGRTARCYATAAGTITHHATDLICPTGRNIEVVAGDSWDVELYDTGKTKITNYQRFSGHPVVGQVMGIALSSKDLSAVTECDFNLSAYSAYGFKSFKVIAHSVVFSGAAAFYCRVSTDDGATFKTTSAYSNYMSGGSGISGISISNGASTQIEFNSSNQAAGTRGSYEILFYDPLNTSYKTLFDMKSRYLSSASNIQWMDGGGFIATAEDTTDIRFLPSTGTMTIYATLYGLY